MTRRTWAFLDQGQGACPVKVAGAVGWVVVALVLLVTWLL